MEGNVKISMNTAVLENKISALNILRDLTQKLGKNFAQFIDPIANLIATKVCHDKTSTGVRKEATKIMSCLLGCCEDQQKMIELLHLFLPQLAQEIAQKLERNDFMQLKWIT